MVLDDLRVFHPPLEEGQLGVRIVLQSPAFLSTSKESLLPVPTYLPRYLYGTVGTYLPYLPTVPTYLLGRYLGT